MLTERQKKAIQELPAEHRGAVAASFLSRQKPARAIRAYCLMCKQGSKAEIKSCDDELCPLLHVRPSLTWDAENAPYKDTNQEQQ